MGKAIPSSCCITNMSENSVAIIEICGDKWNTLANAKKNLFH
jgi:hypothetical protein